MMRKLVAIVVAALLLFCGCAKEPAPHHTVQATSEPTWTTTPQPSPEPAGTPTAPLEAIGGIEVESGLLFTEITLPAVLFTESDDLEATCAELVSSNGFVDGTVNEDGSITVKMTAEAFAQYDASIRVEVETALMELPQEYASILEAQLSDSADKITLRVDRAAWEGSLLDSFSVLAAGMLSIMYQQFTGQEPHCTIEVVDNETEEMISSAVYPDAMNQ